jgi:hypothetical protein
LFLEEPCIWPCLLNIFGEIRIEKERKETPDLKKKLVKVLKKYILIHLACCLIVFYI